MVERWVEKHQIERRGGWVLQVEQSVGLQQVAVVALQRVQVAAQAGDGCRVEVQRQGAAGTA